MIHCINCGHVNAEGASQCEACYETLPSVTSCPTCQASVPDDAFFCPQCGASLPRGVANQPDSPLPDSAPGQQPPAFNDLPPTNVVAQQSLGVSPLPPTNVVNPPSPSDLPLTNDLPPTNVVNPPIPNDLPPTNVVNPAVSSVPPTDVVGTPGIDIPPTNVVHNMPETLPPQAPNYPPEIPPTNVVHPFPQDAVEPSTTSETADAEDSSDVQSEIETVPTMVVSPSSDRDVVDAPLPPPPPAEPTTPPFVPPTMPPQAPPSYQPPESVVSEDAAAPDMPPPDDVSVSSSPVTIPEPTTEAMLDEEAHEFDSGIVSQSVPAATTVQPSMPMVGDTVIQKPPAQMIHERTNTAVRLPTNRDVILVGKTTSTVQPDIDVSGFVDSDVVSRRHAAIFVGLDGYFVEDLGSSNGTYVNDMPCSQGERVPINPGDRISLGRENKVSFIFQVG